MTPELKEQWAIALESGKYQQVTGKLRRSETGMCCLGVLCELVDGSGWKQKWGMPWQHNDDYDMPTAEVLERAELSRENALMLSWKNDNGEPFSEIAKLVRKLP